MASEKKPQDPALLNGASSRFATAFTRNTTHVRPDGTPGGRPWTWVAGAVGLTVCVILGVILFAKMPSGSGTASAQSPLSASARASSSPLTASSSVPSATARPGSGDARRGPLSPAGAGSTAGGTRKTPASSDSPASTRRPGGTSTTRTPSTPGTDSARSGAAKNPEYPGVGVHSHADGRCIAAAGSQNSVARDGTRLETRDCDGGSWQKIDFRSDGTARVFGLCMDIAGASEADGAAIQLATCNGGWAQKFELNTSHDLVNTALGKCVDVVGKQEVNGAGLQLWTCYGTDNQKWSRL
ncbi:ricin-type beta-trefoil lectin domain protein [Streptomyces sp. NPDC087226]|uniref:ricin-type beta-trefoil lectin domain protein n=1 Tax=Streptomyces sp. NPDC087226 TaxID=3365771 RepID=UPI00381DCDB2